MTDFIPFHKPAIDEAEIRSVVETLKSGWLTTGAKVKSFEDDFARYVGSKHAVAVNSGTAALHLALDAVGIGEGDEVIVPTMTFAATAEVVLYFRAKPVLVDCRRDSFNLDPTKIEAAITPKTKAMMPVHMAGQPCEMDPILEIARRHKLRVIEDAAHSLPARYRGDMVGTIGDITCFSFYATKTITTGEGGMATTENLEWDRRMRMMSLHGISHDAWKRYTKEGSWYYEVLYPGFKYNLTDIAAAIGIEQLKNASRQFTAGRLRSWRKSECPHVRKMSSTPGICS
jgi:perosamine synthetase